MRILRILVVLTAVAATLTACTPGRQPLLAVTMVNGLPVAILHGCAKGSAEVSVTENSQAPTTSPAPSGSTTPTPSRTPKVTNTITPETETYVFAWSVKIEDAPMVSEVPLFTAPAGWTVQKNTLTALQKGSRYIADGKLTGVFNVSPVNFTMEELLDLGPGKVLYGINAPLTTVLTRAEFDEKAAQACVAAFPSSTS